MDMVSKMYLASKKFIDTYFLHLSLCFLFITGLLYVDASRKANNASSCSHSCDSNCTSAVVARNGKLAIALTTVIALSWPH